MNRAHPLARPPIACQDVNDARAGDGGTMNTYSVSEAEECELSPGEETVIDGYSCNIRYIRR
jgi:hypothetical protein